MFCGGWADEALIHTWESCHPDAQPSNHVQFDAVYSELRTGDLLLTSARLCHRPGFQGYYTAVGSPWIHLGLVYIREPRQDGSAGRAEDVLIVEMTKNPNYNFSFEPCSDASDVQRDEEWSAKVWKRGGVLMYPLKLMLGARAGHHGGFLPTITPSGKQLFQYYPHERSGN